MITVLSEKTRRAAHGKHKCQWCWRTIRARSRYIDRRCAYDGTCGTFRYHAECDALVADAAAHFGIDDDDDWSEDSVNCFVADFQAEMGLPIGWPDIDNNEEQR